MSDSKHGRRSTILELGCGPTKRQGTIAVDINPSSAADVLHDLNLFPYPFQDNAFDEVICEHVLEHLTDLIGVMEEFHRILRPNGIVRVYAPYFASVFYYRDPTHRTPFSAHTFDYFIAGTRVRGFNYSSVQFALHKVEFPVTPNSGLLKRMLFRFINSNVDFYEHNLVYLMPRHLIYFELAAIKT